MTLNAYFQLVEMSEKLFKNKQVVRSAIGIMKTMEKVAKNKEKEIETTKPLVAEYKASKEYIQLMDDIRKKDEDEDYRTDADPKGFDAYLKALEDPLGRALETALNVV